MPRASCLGCEREGHLDTPATQVLLARVREVRPDAQVTFHMAFDKICAAEQPAVIDWLAEHGVTRILTHGGEEGTRIADNVGRLRAYVARAAGRIGILPGAGITWENAGGHRAGGGRPRGSRHPHRPPFAVTLGDEAKPPPSYVGHSTP